MFNLSQPNNTTTKHLTTMINPTHLRIGNLVSCQGKEYTVKAIEHNPVTDKYYIKVFESFEQLLCDHLEPIELTEERLIEFGYISNPYQDRYERYDCPNIECNKTRGYTELWIERMPHIKYIHQLQNFTFYLSNQELTRK